MTKVGISLTERDPVEKPDCSTKAWKSFNERRQGERPSKPSGWGGSEWFAAPALGNPRRRQAMN
jgi:hypothetical protein